jgi:hypothetical protein
VGARRPGRTQKIAVRRYAARRRESPTSTPSAGCSRCPACTTSTDGRHFAEGLAEAGFPASRSLLSRWESGEILISYEGMSAHEVALGLEVGQISSITGYIKASIPGLKTRVVRPKLDPDCPAFAERLDEHIDITEAGLRTLRSPVLEVDIRVEV